MLRRVNFVSIPVTDQDAETARLSAAGAAVEDGPADAPWHAGVRYALIRDSERNLLLLQSSPMET